MPTIYYVGLVNPTYITIKSKDIRNASGTIHRAKNARINEDGSMTVDMQDWYNFEKWKYRIHNDNEKLRDWYEKASYNGIARVNNHAYEQQEAGQLEPYLINVPLHISKEELEKLEEKLKRRRMKRR